MGSPGLLVHDVEGGDGQPLDEHLHAEELQLPVLRGEDLVDEALREGIHRIDLVKLLHVPLEHLHVPPLVHHLGGRVELAVQLGKRVDELARHQERALLAVEELGEPPGRYADLHLLLLLGGQAREELGAQEGQMDVEDWPFLADGTAPVHVDARRSTGSSWPSRRATRARRGWARSRSPTGYRAARRPSVPPPPVKSSWADSTIPAAAGQAGRRGALTREG